MDILPRLLNAVRALTHTPADFPVYVIYIQKEFISRKPGQVY
jgi:hypothetical protein